MSSEKLIKILTGGVLVAKKVSENLKNKSAEYIKENILHNEFVTRVEHEKLRQVVVDLVDTVKKMENKQE